MRKMKKIEPLVSVIMSTKDTEISMLKDSIDSILNQSYDNFEFIIVCDGSQNDYNFVNKIKDKRIRIIKHGTSIGLTKSLNEALKVCEGEYIARMDSDDYSLKDRFQTQVDFLNNNQNIDICGTFAKQFGDKNDFIIDLFNNIEDKRAELFIYNRVIHPSVMIRKSFLENNNIIYDEKFKYSQDYELWSRICTIANIYIIPKVCLKYRIHAAQISTAKVKEQNALCKEIYLNDLKRLSDKFSTEDTKYLFYLSKKSEEDISKKEIKQFIKKVLKENNESKIYNNRSLKKVLYYRYFVSNIKRINLLEVIYCTFYSNLIWLYIKKKIAIKKCKNNLKNE